MGGLKYVLALLSCVVNVQGYSAVEDAFRQEYIIPDALFNSPQAALYVKYPSGATVQFGNELSTKHTTDQPFVLWNEEPNAYYTLIMLNIDEPSREDPTHRSLLKWLVGNIPGRDIHFGQTLAMYHSPNPRKWSGPHRYVFLVFKQFGKITFQNHWSEKHKNKRRSFGLLEFCDKYDLNTPFAGNFFIAYHELETYRKYSTPDY